MYYVYILQSQKNSRYYIGQTENLSERLIRHNRGGVVSTKNNSPWKIVYSEGFNERISAIRRERQIKSYKGGEAFKGLINGL